METLIKKLANQIKNGCTASTVFRTSIVGFCVEHFSRMVDVRNLPEFLAVNLFNGSKSDREDFIDLLASGFPDVYDKVGLRVCSTC